MSRFRISNVEISNFKFRYFEISSFKCRDFEIQFQYFEFSSIEKCLFDCFFGNMFLIICICVVFLGFQISTFPDQAWDWAWAWAGPGLAWLGLGLGCARARPGLGFGRFGPGRQNPSLCRAFVRRHWKNHLKESPELGCEFYSQSFHQNPQPKKTCWQEIYVTRGKAPHRKNARVIHDNKMEPQWTEGQGKCKASYDV